MFFSVRKILFLITIIFVCKISYPQPASPSAIFGFEPGADYELASYNQLLRFYNQLDKESENVKKIEIGKSTHGLPMILLFISSKENLEKLEEWKDISSKLALAKIDSLQAGQLSQKGKVIVWIDAGMHANELATAQMAPLLAYRVATENTPEMRKIRENVILLLMPVINPDGLEMWHSWYYEHLNTPYETSQVPWLWQEYVGHDNNRDWFMGNMIETRNAMEIIYRQWYPQIVYNHHQPGQNKVWERIFIPPFRTPVNPRINPGVTAGVNEVGSAMMRRFANLDMPGALSGYVYSMYWNGGMRTVPYYHNMIGILSETVHGSPTPRFYDPKDKPANIADISTDGSSTLYPYPWKGGWSHFRDAVDYAYTASIAVLDHAATRRESLLNGIYTMGRQEIRKGTAEGPFAYIIPKNQWDPGEAENLVNIFIRGGIEVQRATENFSTEDKHYEAGSYIIYTSQAFRPYILDLMELQKYPDQFEYPGGPPKLPYDLAGWTLPMQMGIEVNKVKNDFIAKSETITDYIRISPGRLKGSGGFGFLLNTKSNQSFRAINQFLHKGAEVYRITSELKNGDKIFPAGSFIVRQISDRIASEILDKTGIDALKISSMPSVEKIQIRTPKVGIYKSWIANIDEGWTRWLLQNQYEFSLDTLHDIDIQTKDLLQYTSIILPSQSASAMLNGYNIQQMPKTYTGGLGQKGAYALEQYVRRGGTIIAFDAASDFMIEQLGLPVKDIVKGLDSRNFFIPGSLIKATVDKKSPLAWGVRDIVATSFQRSRAFTITKSALRSHDGKTEGDSSLNPEVEVVVKYSPDVSDLLMSGWMLGGKNIAGKPAMVRVPYGEGSVVLFAFRPQFRGQPRGTYKLIFNSIFNSTVK